MIGLIGVLYDGIVMWYEGLALVLAYFFYIVGKFNESCGQFRFPYDHYHFSSNVLQRYCGEQSQNNSFESEAKEESQAVPGSNGNSTSVKEGRTIDR